MLLYVEKMLKVVLRLELYKFTISWFFLDVFFTTMGIISYKHYLIQALKAGLKL